MHKDRPEVMNEMDGGPSWDSNEIVERVSDDDFPLFQQAADSTGFTLREAGAPGKTYTFWVPKFTDSGLYTEERVPLPTTLGPNERVLGIAKPHDQIDHAQFWTKLRELRNPEQ